jgi:hypothetical protein
MARGHIIELGLGGERCGRHVFYCPWGGSYFSRSGRMLSRSGHMLSCNEQCWPQRTRTLLSARATMVGVACTRSVCARGMRAMLNSRAMLLPPCPGTSPALPSPLSLPAASTRGALRGPCSSGGAQRARLAFWQRASRPSRSPAAKRTPASPWCTLTGRATW